MSPAFLNKYPPQKENLTYKYVTNICMGKLNINCVCYYSLKNEQNDDNLSVTN